MRATVQKKNSLQTGVRGEMRFFFLLILGLLRK